MFQRHKRGNTAAALRKARIPNPQILGWQFLT